MSLGKIYDVLVSIHCELKRMNGAFDRLIKRISVLHNEKNVDSSVKPYGWLTPSERLKANEIRKKDPVTFDYVTECLKLFLKED